MNLENIYLCILYNYIRANYEFICIYIYNSARVYSTDLISRIYDTRHWLIGDNIFKPIPLNNDNILHNSLWLMVYRYHLQATYTAR